MAAWSLRRSKMKILLEASDKLLLFVVAVSVVACAWVHDPGQAVVLGAVLLEILRVYSSE